MNNTFKVIFSYDEEPLSEWMRAYTQKAYAAMYDVFCKMTNGMFKAWNNEFDKLYPNIQEDNTDPDSKYMKYIVAKEQDMVDKHINPIVASELTIIERFFIGEEADFRMQFEDEDRKIKTLQMFLKEVA